MLCSQGWKPALVDPGANSLSMYMEGEGKTKQRGSAVWQWVLTRHLDHSWHILSSKAIHMECMPFQTPNFLQSQDINYYIKQESKKEKERKYEGTLWKMKGSTLTRKYLREDSGEALPQASGSWINPVLQVFWAFVCPRSWVGYHPIDMGKLLSSWGFCLDPRRSAILRLKKPRYELPCAGEWGCWLTVEDKGNKVSAEKNGSPGWWENTAECFWMWEYCPVYINSMDKSCVLLRTKPPSWELWLSNSSVPLKLSRVTESMSK